MTTRWKRFLRSVEIILPDEHKKLLTVAIRSRMVQEEASRSVQRLLRMSSEILQLIAYVDGSSHGSPGPAGIGVIVEDAAGRQTRIAKWIGWQDNNVAEYVALLEALQCALARKARSLCVYSDSDVVVRQMSGEYACRSPRLYSLHWVCRKLARGLEFAIERVPRERNREANDLANSAARRGDPDSLALESMSDLVG
jgi:ribonuclease HI